jgi:hypothetical protein
MNGAKGIVVAALLVLVVSGSRADAKSLDGVW